MTGGHFVFSLVSTVFLHFPFRNETKRRKKSLRQTERIINNESIVIIIIIIVITIVIKVRQRRNLPPQPPVKRPIAFHLFLSANSAAIPIKI